MSLGLRKKQQAFIEHYLQTWNASEAARRAGYSEKTAGSMGSENLKKPKIKEAIEERLEELKLASDEVLIRLGEHARSSLAPFVTINQAGLPVFDFSSEEAQASLHWIKKLNLDKDGNLQSIELYDAQSALVHLGRHHALFTDNVDHTVRTPDIVQLPDVDESDG